jgi:predicted DNA-binding antitoxin AbrB/MazE fold protein
MNTVPPSITSLLDRNRSTAGGVCASIQGGGTAMHEHIEVVYENGVFRPLSPLPEELHESERYTVTVETPANRAIRLDAACLAAAQKDADPTVSLEEVRKILAKAPMTSAEALADEREDR